MSAILRPQPGSRQGPRLGLRGRWPPRETSPPPPGHGTGSRRHDDTPVVRTGRALAAPLAVGPHTNRGAPPHRTTYRGSPPVATVHALVHTTRRSCGEAPVRRRARRSSRARRSLYRPPDDVPHARIVSVAHPSRLVGRRQHLLLESGRRVHSGPNRGNPTRRVACRGSSRVGVATDLSGATGSDHHHTSEVQRRHRDASDAHQARRAVEVRDQPIAATAELNTRTTVGSPGGGAQPACEHETQLPGADDHGRDEISSGWCSPWSPIHDRHREWSRKRDCGKERGQIARPLLHDGDENDDQNGEHDRHDAFSSHGNLTRVRTPGNPGFCPRGSGPIEPPVRSASPSRRLGSAQWVTGIHVKVKMFRVLVVAEIRENPTGPCSRATWSATRRTTARTLCRISLVSPRSTRDGRAS